MNLYYPQFGLLVLLLIGFHGYLGDIMAGQIIWRSARASHVTSEDTSLDGRFVFELGVFSSGFVPTKANMSEWVAHWNAAQRTGFDPASSAYTSRYEVESNAAPFALGMKGYVWGYGVDSNEWILMTGANWIWPRSGGTAFPINWTTLTATDLIVGVITNDGSNPHLRTAEVGSVLSPILGPESWRQQMFASEELMIDSISSWTADPDGDGKANLLEYALGESPMVYDSELALTIDVKENGMSKGIEIGLTRRRDRFVTVKMELSMELVDWLFSAQSIWEVLEDGLDAERVWIPWDSIDRQFVRIQARSDF